MPVHSSAPTACLAASAPRGWCRTGAGAAWPRTTAPVCTMRPPTSLGTPSGSTVTLGGPGLLCRREGGWEELRPGLAPTPGKPWAVPSVLGRCPRGQAVRAAAGARSPTSPQAPRAWKPETGGWQARARLTPSLSPSGERGRAGAGGKQAVRCPHSTCRNRKWECTRKACLGTCVAYGDGHFITFDGERYSFEGSCEYTLAQVHGGPSTSPAPLGLSAPAALSSA